MKKVVGVLALAITLNIGYLNVSNAQEEIQCENINGQNVCFAKEIMGELVKDVIYHAGTKVLEKVKESKSQSSNSSPSSSNSNTSNYSNYVNNTSSSNTTDVQEEMIPI